MQRRGVPDVLGTSALALSPSRRCTGHGHSPPPGQMKRLGREEIIAVPAPLCYPNGPVPEPGRASGMVQMRVTRLWPGSACQTFREQRRRCIWHATTRRSRCPWDVGTCAVATASLHRTRTQPPPGQMKRLGREEFIAVPAPLCYPNGPVPEPGHAGDLAVSAIPCHRNTCANTAKPADRLGGVLTPYPCKTCAHTAKLTAKAGQVGGVLTPCHCKTCVHTAKPPRQMRTPRTRQLPRARSIVTSDTLPSGDRAGVREQLVQGQSGSW